MSEFNTRFDALLSDVGKIFGSSGGGCELTAKLQRKKEVIKTALTSGDFYHLNLDYSSYPGTVTPNHAEYLKLTLDGAVLQLEMRLLNGDVYTKDFN